MDTHEREKNEKSWTRREMLAASGAMLLGLAGCDSYARSGNRHTLATSIKVPIQAPIMSAAIPDRPISLAFTGDVMFGRTVNSHLLTTAIDDPYPFTHTAKFLRGFDLTIGNLECVVSRLGAPVDKPRPFILRGDPRAYKRLIHAGFDVVSVANNHSGDYGKEAFVDEIMMLPGIELHPLEADIISMRHMLLYSKQWANQR